jgi:anaerobic dimethyl sulfoxide reductase subunit B
VPVKHIDLLKFSEIYGLKMDDLKSERRFRIMSEEYGFFYTRENCMQCHACEVACKSWRGVELGVRRRRVEKIWQGIYPDVKNLSASISCMHCVEPVCVQVCPVGAISKRIKDGAVLVDREKCTGCQTCLDACPFGAPAFGADGINQKCDMCVNEIDFQTESPPCVETCPTKALTFGKMSVQEKSAMEAALKKLIKVN